MPEGELLQYLQTTAPWVIALIGFGLALKYRREATRNKLKDQHTGLNNLTGFNFLLTNEINHAVRNKEPLSLLYIDFDHMREMNSTYGHPVVDELLKLIPQSLQKMGRKDNIYGRVGGDEFAVMLRNTDDQHAFKAAQILQNFFNRDFPPGFMITSGRRQIAINEGLNFTVGIAQYQLGMLPEDIKMAADDQMKAAKNLNLRNCLVMNNNVYDNSGGFIRSLR